MCLLIMMIILMFYFILGQLPHYIWTWWFVLYIGRKTIIDDIYMLVYVGRGPWSTWLMRCFVLSKELWNTWVIDELCWARSSRAHEYLPLCWARSSGTHENIIGSVVHKPWSLPCYFQHKLWSIESLAIESLGVSYKYILTLVLGEELWNCTRL